MDISGTYKVMYEGDTAGQLEIRKEGLVTVFDCICSLVSRSVLRLYVVSGGNTIPLGVVIPCSSSLTLSRKLTKNDLEKLGLTDRITSVYLSSDGAYTHEKTSEKSSAGSTGTGDTSSTGDTGKSGNRSEECTGWLAEREPWKLFSREDISDSCRAIKGALVKFDGDTSYLAVPISSSEPFPPMPIFCFGTMESIEGRDYIVFTMKNGRFI